MNVKFLLVTTSTLRTDFAVDSRVSTRADTSVSGSVAGSAVLAESVSVSAEVLGGAEACVLVHDVTIVTRAYSAFKHITTPYNHTI